ncbi:hypothetical protein [Chondromyces crocatus]|uniref:Uncharacterized protein n=1 Tax=Chondromyces crocatus TaxID=52 RepID=A0A0K1E5P4_CHOCO|nr:hypothetical protein [Chondromyces crocatus]AKT36195.1 uncharacterized protein CMC5_003090 [Chondromyces crocatus]
MSRPENSATPACPTCGTLRVGLPNSRRCASCGGLLDPNRGARSRARRGGFSPLWCLIALVVQAILTAALVVGLPMVVHQLDFEGSYGMSVAIPVWLLGGTFFGMISPGKMILEPLLASILVAAPTVHYLIQSQTVRTMPVYMYVILGSIGVLFSLVGIYLGERIQMGPPPKPAR